MKSCQNQKQNLANCNCSYEPCSRKGICCECLLYHRKNEQLPACLFPPEIERTYDRSIENFLILKDRPSSPLTQQGRPSYPLRRGLRKGLKVKR